MNNFGIIIFSVIISISFISFIVLTIREYNEMSKNPYQAGKKMNTPSN